MRNTTRLIQSEISRCMSELNALQGRIALHSSHVMLGVATPIKVTKIENHEEETRYEITIHEKTVQVCVKSNLENADKAKYIFEMKAFIDWCTALDEDFFSKATFEKIDIQGIDIFGEKVGFLKFKTDMRRIVTDEHLRKKEEPISSITFMRGGSVAILMVLHCIETGETFSLITVQSRVPIGKYEFPEIPAGMIDGEDNFTGVAAKEIQEETSILVKKKDLIDMIDKANLTNQNFPGIYPSSGGCDEYMKFYLYRTKMHKLDIEKLDNKLTGNFKEGEAITLKVVSLNKLAATCPDMKTLTALYLYSQIPENIRLPPESSQPAPALKKMNYVRKITKKIYSLNNITTSSTLIISTGDISDVDGFYALAEYAKTDSDVMFIMNYPAYLEEVTDNMNPGNGLGYKYGVEKLLERTMKYSAHPSFAKYCSILAEYQLNTNATIKTDPGINLKMKRILTDLAFKMATTVWEESNPSGHLFFVIGGVNTINPFHYNSLKNEVLVYAQRVDNMTKLNTCKQNDVFFQDGTPFGVSYHKIVEKYNEVYMDFNGSMAFFDKSWEDSVQYWILRDILKAVVIMGGVYSHEPPTTMPAIKDTLNRFSCSTMNQLYSPNKTATFFETIKLCDIPVYLVANNAVESTYPYDTDNTPDTVGWMRFLKSNEIKLDSLVQYSAAYYTESPYTAPRKPSDFYTALIIYSLITHNKFKSNPKSLFFDNTYGVALIGTRDQKYSAVIKAYISKCNKRINHEDDASVEQRKRLLHDEQSVLPTLSCNSLKILAVEAILYVDQQLKLDE